MKREIRFRGKRTDNEEWVYGDLLRRYGMTEIYRPSGTIPIVSETVGQFTGLLDKNGKEIFEGDILYDKYEDELEDNGYGEVYYEVVFKDGAFGFMGETTDQFWIFSYNPIATEVVVSNIFDNPELTKVV